MKSSFLEPWSPESGIAVGKELRRAGATMLITDAAARLGMPVSVAERVLTILPLPGRKRIATVQLQAFEEWLAIAGSCRPWFGSVLTDGKTVITGGEFVDEEDEKK